MVNAVGFEARVSKFGTGTRIEFSGKLDESAVLPEVSIHTPLVFDFHKLTNINSVGTKLWCVWIQRLKEAKDVKLENCPSILIKTFGQIAGALPPNMKVISFYIPFYSENTGERRDFLAVRDRHFEGGRTELKIPPIKDSEGQAMEPGVDLDAFLAFLK